jgi:RNA polymerase sigma-70 factor (ECF subfamily)
MGRLRYQTGTDAEDEVMVRAADERQRVASSLARSAEQKDREEDALGQALRELVREFRAKGEWVKLMALELLYVKGLGNAEVAAELTRSEQDIANLKFQAKKRLHDHLTAANLSPGVFPELQE